MAQSLAGQKMVELPLNFSQTHLRLFNQARDAI